VVPVGTRQAHRSAKSGQRAQHGSHVTEGDEPAAHTVQTSDFSEASADTSKRASRGRLRYPSYSKSATTRQMAARDACQLWIGVVYNASESIRTDTS
jgi:hypothetical protein